MDSQADLQDLGTISLSHPVITPGAVQLLWYSCASMYLPTAHPATAHSPRQHHYSRGGWEPSWLTQGSLIQLVECWLSMHKALGLKPSTIAPHKLGMVVHT